MYIEDVDNKKFYDAIVEYKKECAKAEEQGLDKPRLPPYIGECIFRIAKKLSYHKWFMNYSFKDDMIGEAFLHSVKYFDNFDPEKTDNPFAYFTQVCKNAFMHEMMKEEKSRYIMYKYSEQRVTDETGELSQMGLYDNINDFIERYEEKEKKKKERRKNASAKKRNDNS